MNSPLEILRRLAQMDVEYNEDGLEDGGTIAFIDSEEFRELQVAAQEAVANLDSASHRRQVAAAAEIVKPTKKKPEPPHPCKWKVGDVVWVPALQRNAPVCHVHYITPVPLCRGGWAVNVPGRGGWEESVSAARGDGAHFYTRKGADTWTYCPPKGVCPTGEIRDPVDNHRPPLRTLAQIASVDQIEEASNGRR